MKYVVEILSHIIEYLRNLRNSGLNLMTSQQQQSMYENFSLFPQIRSYFYIYHLENLIKKYGLDFNLINSWTYQFKDNYHYIYYV